MINPITKSHAPLERLLIETTLKAEYGYFEHGEIPYHKHQDSLLPLWLIMSNLFIKTAVDETPDSFSQNNSVTSFKGIHPFPQLFSTHIIPSRNPYPNNDANGVEVNLALYLPRINVPKATCYLEFEILGDEFREAFKASFHENKQLYAELLTGLPLAFETKVPFERVDRYQHLDILEKLEIYFSEQDDESCVRLILELTGDKSMEIFPKVVGVFCALHASITGYLLTPPQKDLLEAYCLQHADIQKASPESPK